MSECCSRGDGTGDAAWKRWDPGLAWNPHSKIGGVYLTSTDLGKFDAESCTCPECKPLPIPSREDALADRIKRVAARLDNYPSGPGDGALKVAAEIVFYVDATEGLDDPEV